MEKGNEAELTGGNGENSIAEVQPLEMPKSQGPPPVPDGGFLAWIQCAAVFCIFFNTWGLLNSFGVFQSFYEQNLLKTSSQSDISWIGTIQASFILLGSVYSGPLYDKGHLRTMMAVGSFMLVFGMFMTSLCTKYWQVILAQGIFMGIGLGFLFMPSVGVIATYFAKRRGLAMGIASCGSTIGGIIYPITFSKLIGKIHFGWSTRVLAFIMLFLSTIPVVGVRMRAKPPVVRKIFDFTPWKEPAYTLYGLALFIGYAGMYVPYFYIQIFCLDKDLITGTMNIYLLPIVNAAGFFGRIAFGDLSDRIGPMNSYAISSGICSVLLFGWMGIESAAGVYVFCVLYGFFSSGLITLPATVVATSLCLDMRQFAVRITMLLVISGIGLLIGNPIAGAIVESSWLGLQGFSAGTVLCGTFLTFAARIARVGWAMRARC